MGFQRISEELQAFQTDGIFEIEPDEPSSNSREKAKAIARGSSCYRAVREPWYSQAEIASIFNTTIGGTRFGLRL